MSRHLAHLGRPVSLEELLLQAPRGLFRRRGLAPTSGFGVGWYDASRTAPARYRRAVPATADPSFVSLAGVVWSRCVLAAVRSAEGGGPPEESACAPYLLGDVLFSHLGEVPRAGEALGRLVSGRALAQVGSTADGALVAALVAHRLDQGDGLAEALAATVRLVAVRAPAAGLNLLATDGRSIAATAWGQALVLRSADGAVTVASSPPDGEPGWEAVPDRSLVTASPAAVSVVPLEGVDG